MLKDAADTVEENGIQGSSTCCLVLVDTLQGRLTSANVGDSGFLLIGERRRVRPLPEQVPSRRRFTAQCSAFNHSSVGCAHRDCSQSVIMYQFWMLHSCACRG